ncbi:MAG: septum site-determining protein MinD [Firmicutes bacterium]|nr:septum site-determining protein MinD [Bacillota bacterium]
MFSKEDIEQIKIMAESLEIKLIAETYNVPQDVIKDVLRGDITAENNTTKTSTDFETKIKVVEKARFVRNKTVMAISPGGGMGKTTVLTSLAMASAIHIPNGRPIGIVDLAEYPKVITALGLETDDSIINTAGSILFGDGNGKDYTSSKIQHPALDNLHVIPGVITTDNHLEITSEKMADIIIQFQNQCEITFVDLPASLIKTGELLLHGDIILITLTPDYGSLVGFIQLLPTLKRLGLTNRSFIVLNRIGYPGLLEAKHFRKALTAKINDYYSVSDNSQFEFLGFLPETQDLLKQINGEKENIILSNSKSDFTGEVKYILSKLCPDWQIKTEENSSGIAGILGRLFKQG